MATTIQKRGRRHTATVRYKGAYACSTFSSRLFAEQWADRTKKEIERCLAIGVPFHYDRPKSVSAPPMPQPNDVAGANHPSHDRNVDGVITPTLKAVADEYLTKVSKYKKSLRDEQNRIRQLQASGIAQKCITDITADEVYEYLTGLRHHRTGKPLASVSVRNMAFLMSAIFNTAKATKAQGGFGIPNLTNPIREVRLPSPPKATKQRSIDPDILKEFIERVRRLNTEHKPWLTVFFAIAIQTGMRRSEIIELKWTDIHQTLHGYAVRLNDTKSGYSRIVYLTDASHQDLINLRKHQFFSEVKLPRHREAIFPFSRHYASRKFHEVMSAMGYPEIRLHDLRHTALTNMANAGFSLKELMAQSGHRTATVASRYIHVDERAIRKKFNTIS